MKEEEEEEAVKEEEEEEEEEEDEFLNQFQQAGKKISKCLSICRSIYLSI